MIKAFKKLKKWGYTQLKKVTPGPTAIKGASWALLASALFLYVLFAVSSALGMNDLWLMLFFLILAVVVVAGSYLTLWLLKKINSIPKTFKLALLIAVPLLSFVFVFETAYWLAALLITCLLGAGLYVILKGNFTALPLTKKIVTIAGIGIGLGGLIVGVLAYLPKGFEMKPAINAAYLNIADIRPINAASPAEKGNYTVKTLTYGSGKDRHREEFASKVTITTDTVNGLAFLDNWENLGGWYREKFWGFNATALPVNGYVWYPEGDGPFPLALIVHGNHSMQDFSDTGYAYLGELMASRGIIFASVDENFLNSSWTDIPEGLDEENDARGWMLLEHLRVWHKWNADKESMFYQKIDTNNLALLGHSRGGEAVAHAAFLNNIPKYSDDGTIALGYNFNINAIVAIAPVDGQYQPGNTMTPLKDINYLVLHGSQDGDVSSYMGSQQYERISFSDSSNYFKTGLYVQGANHGQFNTSWGDNDNPIAPTKFLNNQDLLSVTDQETIAKVYISAFLESTLKGNASYRSLFTDPRKGKDWLPKTTYLNEYEDASFEPIASFDEDFNLISTTANSGTIAMEKLSVWREEEIQLKWNKKGSRAVYLGWHYEDVEEGSTIPDSLIASYKITIPTGMKMIDSTSVLSFSMAESTESSNPKAEGKWVMNDDNATDEEDTKDHSEEEEEENDDEDKPKQPIDFTIQMKDSTGQTITFPLSRFSALQREIKVRVWKAQFIRDEDESEKVFQTFSYPIAELLALNPNFNLTSVQQVNFIFNKTPKGVVVVDKIGFTKR